MSGRAGVRFAFVALVSAAVPLFFYVRAWRVDALEGIARKEARAADRDRQLRALAVTAEKLPEFKAEVAALEENLALLERIWPPEPRLEEFSSRLREVCGEEGLEVLETRALLIGKDTAPLDLRVAGTRAAFLSFLERLPRLARLNRVERIQMERREGARFEFSVRIVAFHGKD